MNVLHAEKLQIVKVTRLESFKMKYYQTFIYRLATNILVCSQIIFRCEDHVRFGYIGVILKAFPIK